jgi:hypothetical protein
MTRIITLTRDEVAFIVEVGPYPFVCNQNDVRWPEHTDEDVIEHMAKRHTSLKANRIMLKLMGEIE